jgi:hypothetical protein
VRFVARSSQLIMDGQAHVVSLASMVQPTDQSVSVFARRVCSLVWSSESLFVLRRNRLQRLGCVQMERNLILHQLHV